MDRICHPNSSSYVCVFQETQTVNNDHKSKNKIISCIGWTKQIEGSQCWQAGRTCRLFVHWSLDNRNMNYKIRRDVINLLSSFECDKYRSFELIKNICIMHFDALNYIHCNGVYFFDRTLSWSIVGSEFSRLSLLISASLIRLFKVWISRKNNLLYMIFCAAVSLRILTLQLKKKVTPLDSSFDGDR